MIQGSVWKYGDDINTDVLFPGKYTYTLTERADIARVALEDLDPAFATGVRAGDVIVAGRNFGCGSSREQAATCLVYNGVGAVIAASFSRIFYRNALNYGLLVIASPEAAASIVAGEQVQIDLDALTIRCVAGKFSFPPLSESVRGIVEAGGLIEYVKARLARGGGGKSGSFRMIEHLRQRLLALAYRAYGLPWRLTGVAKVGVRILLVRDGQILLIRHSYLPGWMLPGGGVKKLETLEQAARREAWEEVGATIGGAVELIGIYANFGEGKSDHVALFAAEDFTLDESVRTWEIVDRSFFPLDALPTTARRSMKEHIAEYRTGTRGFAGKW